jgi:hypothetical protein
MISIKFLLAISAIFTLLFFLGCNKKENSEINKDNNTQSQKNTTQLNEQKKASDNENVQEIIRNKLDSWITEINAKQYNLKKFYADNVLYYKNGNVSSDKIAKDKKKAFEKWTEIKMSVENVNISKENDTKYSCIYDKNFSMENHDPPKSYSGKVKSKLIFEKINNDWLITQESDEKVYSSDKQGYEEQNKNDATENAIQKDVKTQKQNTEFNFLGSWKCKDDFSRTISMTLGPGGYYFSNAGQENYSGTWRRSGNSLDLYDKYNMSSGSVSPYGSKIVVDMNNLGRFTMERK